MSNGQPVIHDGQGDAMPCACPACTSPFTSGRRHKPRLVSDTSKRPDGRDAVREGRAC